MYISFHLKFRILHVSGMALKETLRGKNYSFGFLFRSPFFWNLKVIYYLEKLVIINLTRKIAINSFFHSLIGINMCWTLPEMQSLPPLSLQSNRARIKQQQSMVMMIALIKEI